MNIKKEKGFTIIEVVLVLAIAGLIFMMVFIALPALQRSQRDTQRKNDLSRAITALTQYSSNNRGALPAVTTQAWNNFKNDYLIVESDTFEDPTGAPYVFNVSSSRDDGFSPDVDFDAENPVIYVSVDATCNGEIIETGQGSRKVALQMKLEGGGVACENN